MFTWVNANLPASTRANIDVVTFSQYQEQAPMGVAFDQVMKTLRAEFPTQKIGLGELGYWISGQQFWWAYNQTDTLAAKRTVAEQYYNAGFDYPGSIGGVFWWTYTADFTNDTTMQQIVKTLRDKLHSSSPTSTPFPTATATPPPTAAPTTTVFAQSSAPAQSGGRQSAAAKKGKRSKKASALKSKKSKSKSGSTAKKSPGGSAKKSAAKKAKNK
jgi:hypothetical protein